ncbi:MAG: hypothetical protein EFT35_07740 [Methanophagales archaeon ANME-1-THS]|nr:MAG: hypothetical protein EFT35_07740 [Methanophagales archaeon ANME-1-THS]
MELKEYFEQYIGETVSIMIDGKTGKRDSYKGIIEEVSDQFLSLRLYNQNNRYGVETILIRLDAIISIWLYKRKED